MTAALNAIAMACLIVSMAMTAAVIVGLHRIHRELR
jgi:hypothetical protein